MLKRGDRAMPRERPGVLAGDLASVQRDRHDLALVDANLNTARDERGIQRVVVGVKAQMRVRRDPGHPAPGGVGHHFWQRCHHRELFGEPVQRPRPDAAVRARVGLRKPRVELALEVQLVGEPPARLE